MPNLLAVGVLALAYALADRFAGGGAPKLDAKLPGRAVFWGALVCAGLGWLTLGLYGALGALAWFIYRTPGWKVFGGSATPVSDRKIAGTYARHAIAIPLVALAAYFASHSALKAAFFMGAYAVAATALASWYGVKNQAAIRAGLPIDAADNAFVEFVRGAAFGALLALSA